MRNFTLKICLLFFFISPFVAFGDVFIQTLEVGSYKAKFATHNLKKDQGIVVVLHGLLHEDDFIASVDPWIELQISSVGFVFPQGKTLAFNQSPLLGWGPNCLDKQVMFIKELFAHLQKQYRPKWVILAGFSNAAYLVNHFPF